MKFLKFKIWLASIDKRTWAYIAIIAGFVALAVAGLFIWMHLSGYTFSAWIARFWPTVVVVAAALIFLIFALVYSILRKRR